MAPPPTTARPTTDLPRWIRFVLPGVLIDGRAEDRTRRDRVVDAAMYLLAFAIGAFLLADTWTRHAPWLRVADVVVGAAALGSLRWRRSHPGAVGLLTAAASIAFAGASGAALLLAFNAAIRARGRDLGFIADLSIIACFVFPALYPSGDGYWLEVGIGLLLTGIVIGWGLFVRARRELVHSLRERAERAEVEARDAERRRIAREMHDVLAHRISLLSVHAGALEFRPDAPAEEVAEAAGVIRRSARAALEELRDVIGVLRDEQGGGRPEPPQPTLADVPALVAESRVAGMRVALDFAAPDDPLPDALGRTAYRIVQEGLTNARKHAPGAAVDVALTQTEAGLAVQVRSRAPVGVAAGALPGAGTGLIGLAERVSLAGGRLEHGRDESDGAFVLRARLPR